MGTHLDWNKVSTQRKLEREGVNLTPPTRPQLRLIKKLEEQLEEKGIELGPLEVETKVDASATIDQLKARLYVDLPDEEPSQKQLDLIKKFDPKIDPPETKKEASKLISKLIRQRRKGQHFKDKFHKKKFHE